jgi:hypothetical protein
MTASVLPSNYRYINIFVFSRDYRQFHRGMQNLKTEPTALLYCTCILLGTVDRRSLRRRQCEQNAVGTKYLASLNDNE